MRLLLCSTELPPGPGGIGTHAHHLALHLARAGWQVRVVAVQDHAGEDEIAAFSAAQPYAVRRVRVRGGGIAHRTAAYTAELARATAGWRPDVLLACGDGPVLYLRWAAALLRRPWMAVGYGTEFLQGGSRYGRAVLRAFERADAVAVISEYTRGLMEEAGVRPARTVMGLCGADDAAFAPGAGGAARRRLGVGPGPVLLTVGSVKERKGQDVVIRALPALAREFPGVTYLVGGRPHPHPGFQALARELGVERHVRFLGRVAPDELPELYHACDVYVLASRQTERGDVEGYGISVVEAALSGKPAVVARGSGAEETVRDGVTGLVAAPGDPDDTARALGALLRDAELRERMGRAAREWAAAEAGWAARVAVYDGVLRSLAAPAGRGKAARPQLARDNGP
jgi:phosphatidylinositol alpha-1,6-mannosyltransferase